MANGKGMRRPDDIQGSSVPTNGRYITHGDLLVSPLSATVRGS